MHFPYINMAYLRSLFHLEVVVAINNAGLNMSLIGSLFLIEYIYVSMQIKKG